MAVTDFVEEIRSVGERLLLKLKELPQAEPVELVAFSIIVLFTGKWGICPWTLWLCPLCPLGSSQYLGDQPWCQLEGWPVSFREVGKAVSQRKLRRLPYPLTLPKVLGSAGNRKPQVSAMNRKESKGVKGQWSKRQQVPQPLLLSYPRQGEVLHGEGQHHFIFLGPFLPSSYCPGAAADSLQLVLCSLLLL